MNLCTVIPGTVPYKIDLSFTPEQREIIAGGLTAVADIADGCIKIVDYSEVEHGDDYVFITTGRPGCFYEGIGYTQGSGEHRINLNTYNCMVRTIRTS